MDPLENFAVAGIAAMFLSVALPQSHPWSDPNLSPADLPHSVIWANIWIGLFHLLPAYPKDGGRILRAVFGRSMDPLRATRRAVSIGRGFGIAFILAGWWNMPQTTWFFVVGVLLFIAAQMEDRSAVFHSVLETVHLEDIMLTDFATLSPADTLEDALDKAVHSLQDDFPVIRSGDMVGVVSRQKILQTLRSEGNGYVQAVMNRIFEVAQKSESLSSAFRKLSANNLSIIPVVENQQLIGIVTLQNLMHSMALLAETRKLRKAALESELDHNSESGFGQMPLGVRGEVGLTEVRRFVDHAAILQSQRYKLPQTIIRSAAVEESQRRLLLNRKRREKSVDIGAARIESQNSRAAKHKRLPAISVHRA